MKNELLEIWEQAFGCEWVSQEELFIPSGVRFVDQVAQIRASGMSREKLFESSATSMYADPRRHKYAWAVPTPEAIALILSFSPIVEIGAGTGYWAALLRDAGAIVYAYDLHPPHGDEGNHWAQGAETWTDVKQGYHGDAANHPDATLFLCWPPLDTPMASQALGSYAGDHVIYVGEGQGGCTADDVFHDMLDKSWDCIYRLAIPQWLGIHDTLTVWRRA